MEPAIIAAIVGAAGTVLAALVTIVKETKQFRNESNTQHGLLMDMVERTYIRTKTIHEDLQEVKLELDNHLEVHKGVTFIDELPPLKKKPAPKKSK